MLIHIVREALIEALQHVLKAVSISSPIPILAGIKIEAGAKEVLFTASHSSMSIQYRLALDGSSESVVRGGSIVVPARYFYEIIRKCNAGIITLELRENLILTIISEQAKLRLCGMDPVEYPSIQATDHVPTIKLNIRNKLLKLAIKQMLHAVSTSETRPLLTGVCIRYHRDMLTLSATDGVRLASRTIVVKGPKDTDVSSIIPGKNLHDLTTLLDQDEGSTEIEMGTHQVLFRTESTWFRSACIEGVYPNIASLIPEAYLTEIVVKTAKLLDAVERATVLAANCIIKLSSETDKLHIIANTADIGDAQDVVPITAFSGERFSISLNGKYLIDTLRTLEAEEVKVQFTGRMGPIILLPVQSQSSAVFLITPVRTGDRD